MGLGLSTTGIKDTVKKLTGVGVTSSVQNAIKDYAEDLHAELERTSPVDTGTYKGNWEVEQVSDDTVHIKNDTDYAKHLIYPNSRMVGVQGADKPGRGILHNARGIVHKRRNKLDEEVKEALEQSVGVSGQVVQVS